VLTDLAARAKAAGEKGIPGRREVEDRHRREERRLRTDELRAGLAELAGAYRDRAVEMAREASAHTSIHASGRLLDSSLACDIVGATATELIRNPNELLMLEALFIRISALSEA
jgi:DNA polymerase III subunit delta'